MDNALSLIILNGKSADNLPLRNAVSALREKGNLLHVRVTWEKGDAARYVDEAVSLGAATVIAGGGDGTINEVATALAKHSDTSRPALGILPLGTANDFATSVGIPQELENALQLAIAGKAIPIDMVRVNRKQFFINMATGGFGTRITTETPEKLKAALGGVSYLLYGLMRVDRLKPDDCEIRGENFHWQGDALVIGIGNGCQAGGGQQLCPEARVNDGLLNLRIFTVIKELLPALLTTMTHTEENAGVIDASSTWFDITTPNKMTFNLDGESLTGHRFFMDIQPGAIACRLPTDCPLLK